MGDPYYTDTIHWQKNRFRGALVWSIVMIAAGAALGVLVSHWIAAVGGGIVAAVGVIFLVFALSFRTLRVRIDDTGVYLTLGVFRKRIPLEDISVMGTRRWQHEGNLVPSWGVLPVSEGPDRYVAWGGTGDCVAIVTNPGARYLISATDSGRFLGALGKAISDLPAPTPSRLHIVNKA